MKSSPQILARAKRYRDKHKNDPHRKAYMKQYREKNKDLLKEKYQKFRIEVLTLYSEGKKPFCVCCKEDEIKFLALDHINGGGTKHRKSLNTHGGNSFYFYLKKLGYPKEFQVMCHNCNMAKGSYGKCPHETN